MATPNRLQREFSRAFALLFQIVERVRLVAEPDAGEEIILIGRKPVEAEQLGKNVSVLGTTPQPQCVARPAQRRTMRSDALQGEEDNFNMKRIVGGSIQSREPSGNGMNKSSFQSDT